MIDYYYDGYVRSFMITTPQTRAFAADAEIGMCWVIEGATISCCSWTSDGADTFTPKSYSEVTFSDEGAATFNPVGINVKTLTEVALTTYPATENYWYAQTGTFTFTETVLGTETSVTHQAF